MGFRDNLVGQRFGRLMVLKYVGNDINRHSLWLCECECGAQIVETRCHLTTKHTLSCGCLRRDIMQKIGQSNVNHGFGTHPLYCVWNNMKRRCDDEHSTSYDYYGNRGIRICDEWYDFLNFYQWSIDNGYEEGLTLDRVDTNGNYEPTNCRWVSWDIQCNNKRNNRHISYNSETHTVAEWSKILNVNYNSLLYKINHNDMRDFDNYFK